MNDAEKLKKDLDEVYTRNYDLAQRQQDFDMAERRARFALEGLKTYVPSLGEDEPFLKAALKSVMDFLTMDEVKG